MVVLTDAEAGLVRKEAQTDSERTRLAREASVLRLAAHPGIVQLVRAEGAGGEEKPYALVLRRVTGSTLAERSVLAPSELAWLGAGLATTLADLHEIGVVHRSLKPDHVLIDEEGRAVLCGFGAARYASGGGGLDASRREDVKALAELLIGSGAGAGVLGPKAGAALRAAASDKARTGWRGRTIDARFVAEALAAVASGGQSAQSSQSSQSSQSAESSQCGAADRSQTGERTRPGAVPTRPRSAGRRTPGRLVAAGAMVAAAALVLAGALRPSARGPSGPPARTHRAEPGAAVATCPTQDAGCVPVPSHGGMIGPGFRILGAIGVTVIGRWDCSAVATPAVLDTASGNLWVFDSWPRSGQRAIARLVASATGGSSLKVIPAPGSNGCDRIEVDRNGRVVLVASPHKGFGGPRA